MKQPGSPDQRASFLIAMYSAMWDNINRHILVVWQSVTALFAALAAAYLSERGFVNPELASTFVVLTVGWSLAHTVDARVWFNRNLQIISNIERQFLASSDCQEVHYFFCRPHRRGTIEHLLIQGALGVAVGVIALGWHFSTRVMPGFGSPWSSLEAMRSVPYLAALAVLLFVRWLLKGADKAEAKLQKLSPGKTVPVIPEIVESAKS